MLFFDPTFFIIFFKKKNESYKFVFKSKIAFYLNKFKFKFYYYLYVYFLGKKHTIHKKFRNDSIKCTMKNPMQQ